MRQLMQRKHQLTIPEGPALNTEGRSLRRSFSCPSAKESSSMGALPGHEGSASARLVRPGTTEKPNIRVVAAAARAERSVRNVGVFVAARKIEVLPPEGPQTR